MVKDDIATDGILRLVSSLGQVFLGRAQHFGDAPKRNQRTGSVNNQPAQVADRPNQPSQKSVESDQIADGDNAIHDHCGGNEVASNLLSGANDVGYRPEQGVHGIELLAQAQFFEVVVLILGHFVILARKRFDDTDTAQVFLQVG